MDYYVVLKVLSGAKQVELDRAYQKLIKEARYDNSINRKDVEIAYRTLSDQTQRALYDATQAEKIKRTQTSQKIKKKDLAIANREANRSKYLVIMFVVLLTMFVLYYQYRFGYNLQSFEVGDTLYYKDTEAYFGRIKGVEDDHNFGDQRKDAYLVTLDQDLEIWFPVKDVKSICYKK